MAWQMNEEEFLRFLGEMAKQDTALTAITTKIGEFSKQLATVVSHQQTFNENIKKTTDAVISIRGALGDFDTARAELVPKLNSVKAQLKPDVDEAAKTIRDASTDAGKAIRDASTKAVNTLNSGVSQNINDLSAAATSVGTVVAASIVKMEASTVAMRQSLEAASQSMEKVVGQVSTIETKLRESNLKVERALKTLEQREAEIDKLESKLDAATGRLETRVKAHTAAVTELIARAENAARNLEELSKGREAELRAKQTSILDRFRPFKK
jgi:chromosome segregation ATPase